MRQLGDLAVWVGLVLTVIGVVHFTPVVADYLTDDQQVQIMVSPPITREYALAHHRERALNHPSHGLIRPSSP